jgi:ribosomal-protein-alanine N-acetyltransferase
MMRQLMAWVRELAIDQILLEVRPSNTAAIRLYRKLGFQEIGLRKGYYPNHAAPTQPAEPDSGSSGSSGREDAIVMRRSGLCSGKAVGRPHE